MQETGQTQRANDQASQRTQQESRTLVASFASLMNAKARDIGCYDTHFVTPNGLDGEDEGGSHATTAADLARILRYCMIQSPRKSEFLEITGQASYSFVNQAGNRSFTVNNHNAFLQMMDGALTGKTGFTSQAGYCYVGALTRDGKTYIAALLACGWPNHKSYKWSDMRKLMNYALERYTYQRFDSAGFDIDVIDPIPVDGAQGQVLGEQVLVNVKVSQAENEKSRMDGLLLRDDEKIQVEWNVVKKLEAPVEAGTPVGKVQYLVNGEVFKTELLTAADTVQEINLNWCMKQVVKGYLI